MPRLGQLDRGGAGVVGNGRYSGQAGRSISMGFHRTMALWCHCITPSKTSGGFRPEQRGLESIAAARLVPTSAPGLRRITTITHHSRGWGWLTTLPTYQHRVVPRPADRKGRGNRHPHDRTIFIEEVVRSPKSARWHQADFVGTRTPAGLTEPSWPFGLSGPPASARPGAYPRI